ncbi:MAG: TlpA family protein disulfide reductase [Actinomycetota bacterium]|nr:TlpA family protein disulfide reductase [Actinomycetota bacterium]
MNRGPADQGAVDQGPAEPGTAEAGTAEPGTAGPGTAGPGLGQLTWRGAVGEVWRSAARHKLAAIVVALCVAGSLAALALTGSGPGRAAPAADPVAAAFSLPGLGHSGSQVSLSDYSGHPVIVNFFASWCGPCQQETPLLARFYRTDPAKVALVGLDENDVLGNATAFTRAHGVTYPVGFDPHFSAANAYGVVALPQTFFLNAKHRIVDRIFGAVTLTDLNKGIALAMRS